jgi:mono/diheme cytochrome c family protein
MVSKEDQLMNTSKLKYLKAVVLVLILAFAGSFASAVSADEAKKGDAARGVKEWADNCARCHNIRDPKEMRDDQWKAAMFHMRVRAGLTGQQTRDILQFLQNSN